MNRPIAVLLTVAGLSLVAIITRHAVEHVGMPFTLGALLFAFGWSVGYLSIRYRVRRWLIRHGHADIWEKADWDV